MTDTALAERGHNVPPSDAEILSARLAEKYDGTIKRRDELLASALRAPPEVADEGAAGKFADLIKLITACTKNAEAERVAEKEPHLAAGRAVDGFFKRITDELAGAKKTLEQRLTTYQRKKAEDERRRREEEERLRREEAERLAREAAAREAELKNEDDLAAAIAAEEAAKQADADAVKAKREASAKAADLSRSRSDIGSVASLRTYWDFDGLDRETVDLEALRPYIALAAIEAAMRGFIRAGGREIRGARIFENTETVVR